MKNITYMEFVKVNIFVTSKHRIFFNIPKTMFIRQKNLLKWHSSLYLYVLFFYILCIFSIFLFRPNLIKGWWNFYQNTSYTRIVKIAFEMVNTVWTYNGWEKTALYYTQICSQTWTYVWLHIEKYTKFTLLANV